MNLPIPVFENNQTVLGLSVMQKGPYILKSGSFQVKKWVGGTTKELFIFPPEARYPDLNFDFRINTATVEIDESEFSRLPGVSRKLMVLSGATTLIHENHHSRKLTRFETDSFEGDWKTTSQGQCTDFNLMTTGKTSGQVRGMEVQEGQTILYNFQDETDWGFLFLHSGRVSIRTGSISEILHSGDLMVVPEGEPNPIELTGLDSSLLVFVEIS